MTPLTDMADALRALLYSFTEPGSDGWFSDPVHSDEVTKARAILAAYEASAWFLTLMLVIAHARCLLNEIEA